MSNKLISVNDIKLINSICLFMDEPFQILDINRIESALSNQYQPYPNLELAFASTYKSLVINHGFMNGNKRTAVIYLYIASKMIGHEINIGDKDLADLTYRIAGVDGSHISVEEIASIVYKNKKATKEYSEIDNIKELAKEYVNNHKWLMEVLGA